MMAITRTLVLTLALFVSTPALAQSVEVKDLRTGSAVKLAVDRPIRLVLPSDRLPPSPVTYGRSCRYARYASHGYYERQHGPTDYRRHVGRLATFVAALIVGFSVISMVRSLERWRASQ